MKLRLLIAAGLAALVLSACAPSAAPVTRDRLKLPGVLAYEQNLPTLVARQAQSPLRMIMTTHEREAFSLIVRSEWSSCRWVATQT